MYRAHMPRLIGFLIFLSLFLALIGGAHFYVWARLVRDLELSPRHQALAATTLKALFALVPLTLLLSRQFPPSLGRYFLAPGYIWIGTLFLATVTLLAFDGVRLVLAIADALFRSSPPDLGRRLALTRLLGVCAGAVTLGLTGLSLWRVRSPPGIRRVEIPLARLPRALDGMTIAQLTDIHVGPTIGRAFIEDIVQRVNALDADIVAITGDLVDGDVQNLADAIGPLADLRSRHGTFFVTGNHEYYSGAEAWCRKLSTLGIRVLRNERVTICRDPQAGAHSGEPAFDLAGVDDYSTGSMGRDHAQDIQTALAGRDENRELVLLAHQPRSIFEAMKHGVGLQISGHTHGGQLWPFNYLVKLQQPVVQGLERLGDTWIYVSRGTGYWGPPMRLAAPAEITQLVLRATA